jgi:hypothetical protein
MAAKSRGRGFIERALAGFLLAVLAVSLGSSQEASPANPSAQPIAKPSTASTGRTGEIHGLLIVQLARALDSKNLKPGNEVEAKLLTDVHMADGGTIPRGSLVKGHVTEAKARSKGDSESTLAFAFDSIVNQGRTDKGINFTIQALAPNPDLGMNTGSGIGYFDLTQDQKAPLPPSQTPRSIPLLTEESTGVLGIKNLELGPDGVLTSSGREVKLDVGTRILIKVSTP